MVEQGAEDARVSGSSPLPSTIDDFNCDEPVYTLWIGRDCYAASNSLSDVLTGMTQEIIESSPCHVLMNDPQNHMTIAMQITHITADKDIS